MWHRKMHLFGQFQNLQLKGRGLVFTPFSFGHSDVRWRWPPRIFILMESSSATAVASRDNWPNGGGLNSTASSVPSFLLLLSPSPFLSVREIKMSFSDSSDVFLSLSECRLPFPCAETERQSVRPHSHWRTGRGTSAIFLPSELVP